MKNKCVGLDCEMCANTKCPNKEKEISIPIYGNNVVPSLLSEIARLQEENEGLKSLNDFNVQKIEVLQEENKELKKYQYKQEYLQSEIEKRQKALKKIREKCLKMCNICDNIDGETYLDDCNSICEYCKIIKLINEALNDRD